MCIWNQGLDLSLLKIAMDNLFIDQKISTICVMTILHIHMHVSAGFTFDQTFCII
jgi:hypothetical protein